MVVNTKQVNVDSAQANVDSASNAVSAAGTGQLQSAVTDASNALSAANNNVTTAQENVDSAFANVTNAQSKVATAQSNLDNAQTALDNAKFAAVASSSDLATLQKNYDSANAVLDAAKSAASGLPDFSKVQSKLQPQINQIKQLIEDSWTTSDTPGWRHVFDYYKFMDLYKANFKNVDGEEINKLADQIYTPSKEEKNTTIDLRNYSFDQHKELSLFAVTLLNQIHRLLNIQEFKVTENLVDIGIAVGKQYAKDNWNEDGDQLHDLNGIYSLEKEYGTEINEASIIEPSYYTHYEPTSMADVKWQIVQAALAWIFGDSGSWGGHTLTALGLYSLGDRVHPLDDLGISSVVSTNHLYGEQDYSRISIDISDTKKNEEMLAKSGKQNVVYELPNVQTLTATAAVKTAQANLDNVKAKLEAAESADNGQSAIKAAQATVDATKTALANAQSNLDNAKTELADAQSALTSAKDNAALKQAAYNQALELI